MVVWMIGLSGAGKTTIGREVWKQWQRRNPAVVMLDGDEIRAVIGRDPHGDPYSPAGRRRNAERMTALCELLDRQGIDVICCILSIFPDMRAANRQRFRDYFEVHVATPLDVCISRDVKNVYAPALRGETENVVGVDIPFEPPSTPDLVLDNSSADADPVRLAAQVLAALDARTHAAQQVEAIGRAMEVVSRSV